MTKIEELRAAYEAATQGEWKLRSPGNDPETAFDYVEVAPKRYIFAEGLSFDEANNNARLIQLMHNNLPALLEAVELLHACQGTMQNMALQIEQMKGLFDDEDGNIAEALEDCYATESEVHTLLKEKLQ